LSHAGLPTINDATLEWILKPVCNTPQQLAQAKAGFIASSNRVAPDGNILILGVPDHFANEISEYFAD
jgi:hypothetical protein